MLIYGCSRLQPFKYNGICYENCSWFVFYSDGIERCIDQICEHSYAINMDYPRNWTICIECEYFINDTDKFYCRRSCSSSETRVELYFDEYMCVNDIIEVALYEASKDYTFKMSGVKYIPFCDFPQIYLRTNDETCY